MDLAGKDAAAATALRNLAAKNKKKSSHDTTAVVEL